MEPDELDITSSNSAFDDWYNELNPVSSDNDVDEVVEDDYSENDYE
jgi:hypothetical protein